MILSIYRIPLVFGVRIILLRMKPPYMHLNTFVLSILSGILCL